MRPYPLITFSRVYTLKIPSYAPEIQGKLNLVRVRVDCSQSPIFSWDRLDMPRLTVTAMYRGGGRDRPRTYESFDTHARWQPARHGPGGVLPYMAAVKGMVFKQFTLG